MARKNRHYSKEFTQEAIELSESSGKRIVDIEQDLGLSRGLLNRWKKKHAKQDRKRFVAATAEGSERLLRIGLWTRRCNNT